MFFGELLCLGAYGIKLLNDKRKFTESYVELEAPPKKKINPILFAIPAVFDIIASTLNNVALTMVAGSVYQMMRGLKIAITAFMSVIFLKRKLYRHHWSSVLVIFVGLVLVGVAVLTGTNSGGI